MKATLIAVVTLFAASAPALPNGGIWKDTDGVHINAHGGGLLKDGDVWYWYGEHKVEGKAGNRAQVGVGCYSSRDLGTWKNEGIALTVSNEEGHDIEKDGLTFVLRLIAMAIPGFCCPCGPAPHRGIQWRPPPSSRPGS